MCSQRSNVIEMPSPTVSYHEPSSVLRQQNLMQHRNNINNLCHQQENSNQFEYDDENSSQQQQFPQYHNNNYDYNQNHSALNETQQQADQHTIELRMNNLGNEDTV